MTAFAWPVDVHHADGSRTRVICTEKRYVSGEERLYDARGRCFLPEASRLGCRRYEAGDLPSPEDNDPESEGDPDE